MAITTSDLADWTGITDTADNTTLAFAVDGANQAVRRWCGRTFAATTTGSASARVFVPRRMTLCFVDDFWHTDNLVVKTGEPGAYSTTLTRGTDFDVEPLNGQQDGVTVPYHRLVSESHTFATSFRLRATVQVIAAWGWASVPADVKLASLIKAARLWKRKNSPEGVVGGFADFGAVRISRYEDPDCVSLLAPYRRFDAAVMT